MLKKTTQAGIVLITVLLLVVLLAVVVGQLSHTTAVDHVIAQNQVRRAKLDQALQSGIAYATAVLAADSNAERKYDATQEPWAAAWSHEVDEVRISGDLVDQESCFNLYRLVQDPDVAQADLERVLADVREGTAPDGPALSRTISGWIRAKENLKPEIAQKLGGRKLGGAAPMYTILELNLLKDIDPEVLLGVPADPSVSELARKELQQHALVRHLTVWGTGRVNVNTASRAVLTGLHPDMSPALADAIRERASEEPFTTVEALRDLPGLEARERDDKSRKTLFERIRARIDVRSTVFRLEITARLDRLQERAWVILKRDAEGVRVLQFIPMDEQP